MVMFCIFVAQHSSLTLACRGGWTCGGSWNSPGMYIGGGHPIKILLRDNYSQFPKSRSFLGHLQAFARRSSPDSVFPSDYLPVCLSSHLSISLSSSHLSICVCILIYLSICLSSHVIISMSVCMSVSLPICLIPWPHTCLYARLSVSRSVYLPVCPPICLMLWQPVCLYLR